MQILKKEMKLKGYTVAKLAKTLGKTTANVHGWIKGSFVPHPDTILELKRLGFTDTACLEPSKNVEV